MLTNISDISRLLCGIILITVPTIEFGGVFLLKMLRSREPGYLDNPIRQNLFRAGHAHAGVIVILSLICQVLVDSIILPGPIAWVVRIGVPAAAILIPAGFFLSVASPRSEYPNGMIRLVYLGALVLALSVLILGVTLVHAAFVAMPIKHA
jgi:hypothetical protein